MSIQGWYATAAAVTAGGTYFAVAPTRVFDSRDGTGTTATRVAAGETRTVAPTVAGVPTTGVAAVTAEGQMRSDWMPDSGGGVWLWLVRHVPNHPRTWAVAFLVMALGLIGLGEVVLWQIVQSNNEKTGQHMSMWYPLMLQLLVLVVAGSVSIRNYRRRG